jgi:hypothetical protein
MLLPDLRLVERETELPSNRRREVRQPIKRVDKPDQLARVFWLLSPTSTICQNWHKRRDRTPHGPGADCGNVLRLAISHGVCLALIGLMLGLAAAFVVTGLLSAILFAVKPSDPPSYAAVAALHCGHCPFGELRSGTASCLRRCIVTSGLPCQRLGTLKHSRVLMFSSTQTTSTYYCLGKKLFSNSTEYVLGTRRTRTFLRSRPVITGLSIWYGFP